MRTRSLVAVATALGIPTLLFLPLLASAAGSSPPSGAAASSPPNMIRTDTAALAQRPHDPNNQTNISDFMVTCIAGNAKYLSRDFDGAIDAYRKAIQLSVKDPLGYYLLGEGQLAKGNVTEAEASWKQAELVADPKIGTNAMLRARILFVLADVKERQKKWDDAKAAWARYDDWASTAFAASASDAGALPRGGDAGAAAAFPANGAGRVLAIDAMLKQDKNYEHVRAAIRNAASADGGLFTNLDATPG